MKNDAWMRKFLLRCLFGTAALLGASFAQGGPFDGWGYHAPVTFNGYGRSETLTNFPALVVVSNACFGGAYAFSYGQLQSGSNDLAFTDADGNSLNYEIETWNPAGASTVWVQVPVLTSNTTVTAWWGAPGQDAPACTTNGATWANGYAAVWHLNQNGTPFVDSSTNSNNSTATGRDPALASGKIGQGQHFDGSSTYIRIPTSSSIKPTSRLTLSAWVNVSQFTSGSWPKVFSMPHGTSGWNSPYTDYELNVSYNGNTQKPGVHVDVNPSSSQYYAVSSKALDTGAWHLLTGTYDGSTVSVYLDGISQGSVSVTGPLVYGAGDLAIGANSPYSLGEYFSGTMDELRISSVARSSNWVWAEYQNAASNTAFQTYGTVATSGGIPAIQNVAATNVTQTSACPNGLLTTDGSSAATVTLYWGPTDGETNAAAWSNAVSFGANARPTPAAYTTNLTGLTSGTTYYYRYCATNDAGSSWAAPSLSFTTLAVPVVGNAGGATQVFSSTATLNGTVVSGNPAPSVYICWGTSDGGATATGAWQHVVALGVQSGAFSTSLSGLMPGTAYSYRCYAVNSQGEAWSSASAPFTTAVWTLNGSTLSDGNWSLTVSAAGGNYTVTGCSAGSGDLDLRHTGYTITAIGYHAFYGNTRIVSVELPDTVTGFGDGAFEYCTMLTNVAPLLPGGVTSIGHEAFAYSPITGDLVLTNAGPVTLSGNSQFRDTKIFSATLGKGVTAITWAMFLNCTALGSVSMSDGVKSIDTYAFGGCSSLTNVVPLLPGGLTSLGSAFWGDPIAGDLVLTNAGPITLIDNSQFYGTKITSATLGCGVTNIPWEMFYNCKSLGAVSMSDNVQSIDTFAFFGCTSLTNVAPLLPRGLASLGGAAFYNCPIAGDLVVGNAGPVTLLPDSQFYGAKIASATLGVGVTNLPASLFEKCTSLQRVYFCGYPAALGSGVFRNTANYQMRTYIPKGNAGWQPITANQVTALTADETTAFQAAYVGEVLPLGTWVPSGAGKAWYCSWVAPQDQHKGTVMRLK